jgi:hypothetical protein
MVTLYEVTNQNFECNYFNSTKWIVQIKPHYVLFLFGHQPLTCPNIRRAVFWNLGIRSSSLQIGYQISRTYKNHGNEKSYIF